MHFLWFDKAVLFFSLFSTRWCSRCVFYLLYHNLFEFGVVFFSSLESDVRSQCAITIFTLFIFESGIIFYAVVIRPIAKNSVLMTTVMNIKLYRRFICTFHAFAELHGYLFMAKTLDTCNESHKHTYSVVNATHPLTVINVLMILSTKQKNKIHDKQHENKCWIFLISHKQQTPFLMINFTIDCTSA